MPPKLTAQDLKSTIIVDKSIILIGRHPECDIQLNSRKISRKHCFLALANDCLFVRDLESTNGILVNDIKKKQSELISGDQLTIGDFVYIVSMDPSEKSGIKNDNKSINQSNLKVSQSGVNISPQSLAAKLNEEALENADEPVPLDESLHPAEILPAKPFRPITNFISEKVKDPKPAFFIPDELSLLPLSSSHHSSNPSMSNEEHQ